MTVLTALLEDASAEDLAVLAQRLAPHLPAPREADAEALLTVGELAAFLHVDPEWVRRHQAKLGAFRLSDGGGRNPVRFRRSDVERFLRERRLDPPESRGSWRDDPDWAVSP